jgi:endonuclease III
VPPRRSTRPAQPKTAPAPTPAKLGKIDKTAGKSPKPPAKARKPVGKAAKAVKAITRTAKRVIAKAVTKATRKPLRMTWPPDPARVQAILSGLEALYPDVKCELDHDNAFQLIIATILSAQTTDVRVNLVTPALFAAFPTPAAMAEAPAEVLEDLVRPTGFFRQKALSIKATAAALVEKFNGEVPRSMDELLTLRGVARKTANVVLGTAYGIATGVVVDTHVQRLSLRLALTRQLDPRKIEEELMTVIPRDHWIRFSHQLIWHGRRVCFARKPDCEHCPLAPHCPSAFAE